MNRIVNSLIRRICDPAADYLLNKRARNIELELQFSALRTTAAYVEEHMREVRAFDGRLDLLGHALEQVTLPGMYVEFGVFQAVTINYTADRVRQTVHGFDSFEGLPEFWRDGYDKGRFAVGKSNLPAVRDNVKLHVGWFSDTVPPFAAEHSEDVAFMHVDCDLYTSTKVIFEHLGSRIKPGSIILFDEYFNFTFWQHYEYKAFQELVAERGLRYEYLGYTRKAEQVAVRILE